jgi:peptidyl-prolyl cis-trans isomerase C
MTKLTNLIAGFAIVCATALPVVAQETTADTVVATVNGTEITIGHMIAMRDSLPEKYQNLPDDVLFKGLLDQAIQQTALAETITTTPQEIELRLENQRRTLLAGIALDQVVKSAVTDEALQAAYDARFANAEPSREYNASHILVATEDEAKALITQLEGGADFAELAKEKSTGPSGPNGGELGWFSTGMMVQPFEEAVVAMKVGQISAPVQTQFGWHVIKLNETRLKDTPTLDDVRTELSGELQQKAVDAAVAELTAAADVVRPDVSAIDPAILRDLSLIAN